MSRVRRIFWGVAAFLGCWISGVVTVVYSLEHGLRWRSPGWTAWDVALGLVAAIICLLAYGSEMKC